MNSSPSRRKFLTDVGQGTLLATLGTAVAIDMRFVSAAWIDALDSTLLFGSLEPLVCEMQETPINRLQSALVDKIKSGTSLKTLIAAGALANARTFGGEDYIGFHTFMALAPALRIAARMPAGLEPLPVLKVLYRNTSRIQNFGGRGAEVLADVPIPSDTKSSDDALQRAIQARDPKHAERILANLVGQDRHDAFEALIPSIQDNPEVHRTVLPFRAWEMQDIVGTEHALTLLRQSLRYCVRADAGRGSQPAIHGAMLVKLMDEAKLNGRSPGTRRADDDVILGLRDTFLTASPEDSGRAAAGALAEGFSAESIGEAMSLAASGLVLRDGGRLPQWEDRLKTAGSVHGDSMGVHASDSANAWRNLARICSGRNAMACLILGAWQIARDRDQPGNLLSEPLPSKHHVNQVTLSDPEGLLERLDESIRNNLQAHAAAIVERYAQLSLPTEPLMAVLARFAVSEDGALHAEKYYNTVSDDFQATRPSLRGQHLVALARVTASEFGSPAEGQEQARELLEG